MDRGQLGLVWIALVGCTAAVPSDDAADDAGSSGESTAGESEESSGTARVGERGGDRFASAEEPAESMACGGAFAFVPTGFARISAPLAGPGLQAVAHTWPFSEAIDYTAIDLQTPLAPCGDALAPDEPVGVAAATVLEIPGDCGDAAASTAAEVFPNLSADPDGIVARLDLAPSELAPYGKSASASLEACNDDCCGGRFSCTNEYSASTDLLTHQEARVHGFTVSHDGWLRIDASAWYQGTFSSGDDPPGSHNFASATWQLLVEGAPSDDWADVVDQGALLVDPGAPLAASVTHVPVDTAHEYRLVLSFTARASANAEASLCGDQDASEGYLDGHSEFDVAVTLVECPGDPDLDGDGEVGASDLGLLLGAWGTAAFDLTCDGIVDAADLGVVLGAWG